MTTTANDKCGACGGALSTTLARLLMNGAAYHLDCASVAFVWPAPASLSQEGALTTASRAVILWEMLSRPLGQDGLRILQQALEKTPPEQIVEMLKDLARRG